VKPRAITVFSHSRPSDTGTALRHVVELATNAGVEVRLPPEEVEKHGLVPGAVATGDGQATDPDLVVVLGGDGTILTHLRAFAGSGVPA
jgi:NAD+ kinase